MKVHLRATTIRALAGIITGDSERTPYRDHLHPQSFGGGDDAENLLLAHHGCNASRGNRDVVETRLALAGTDRAPMSTGEKAVATALLTVGGGARAGHVFARVDGEGNRVFNEDAAFWGGLACLLLSAGL